MNGAADIRRLHEQISSIIEHARQLESRFAKDLAAAHPAYRECARNLVHYVALRQTGR